MVEILASIVGALAAGALAKAGEIGSRAAVDAYDGLRALMRGSTRRSRPAVPGSHAMLRPRW